MSLDNEKATSSQGSKLDQIFDNNKNNSSEATSAFQKLPLDLLRPVMEYLPTWDLLSAISTCRSFAKVGTPLLYEVIDMFLDESELRKRFPEPEQESSGASSSNFDPVTNDNDADELLRRLLSVKTIRLLQSMATRSNSKSAKELRLHYNFKTFFTVPIRDCQFTTDLMLGFISTDKLTSLSVDSISLAHLPPLLQLQKLNIRVPPQDIHDKFRGNPQEFPWKHATVAVVSIKFEDFDLAHISFHVLLDFFFYMIKKVPGVKDLQLIIKLRPDTPKVPRFMPAILATDKRTFDTIQGCTLPLMKVFKLRAPTYIPPLLYQYSSIDPVQATRSIIRTFSLYDALATFLNRHIPLIERICWVAPIGLRVSNRSGKEDKDTEPALAPFSSASSIEILAPELLDGTASIAGRKWIQRLVETQAPGLNEMLVRFEGYRALQSGDFIADVVPKFHNLRRLGLYITGPLPPAVYTFLNVLDSIGSISNLMQILPSGLQALSIVYTEAHGDPAPSGLQTELKDMLDLFKGLLGLNHASFRINGPNSLDEVVHRRRPVDYMKSDVEQKKVCVWHIRTSHKLSSGQSRDPGLAPHLVLHGYREHLLPRASYLGVDGEKFVMPYKEVEKVRKCKHNGIGGCDHVLLRKGFWVPRAVVGGI